VAEEEIDLLRSVLKHAYEKRRPFPIRAIQAVKRFFGSRRPRKPVIQNLNIEGKKDAA
jgi:hypothetical protein